MYRVIQADKDTYITDKLIRGQRTTGSNVGIAGTLDVFKLYGNTKTGNVSNVEKSRLLLHFDLEPIRTLINQGSIDINDNSFWCKLSLKDVYGGQPTPNNFKVSIFPLSASFQEGLGKDVVYYSDRDACNWASSSYGTLWYGAGCSVACNDSSPGDFITSSIVLGSTEVTQSFSTGYEDLVVDVTKIVSATLAGILPDAGFRVALTSSLENDTNTYFVKRFGSRQVYDISKRPTLTYGFDDSVADDTQNLVFDNDCRIGLYNYIKGDQRNIVSASTAITGTNSIILKLVTDISGGFYEVSFTGSQQSLGSKFVTGSYFAVANVSSTNANVAAKILASGSVKFTPYWKSLDGSVCYHTGSVLTFRQPERSSSSKKYKSYVVNVVGLRETVKKDTQSFLKVNIFDYTNPYVVVSRVPVETPGIVLNNVFYSVRDAVTHDVVIPFDTSKNSTKVSSDAEGMFFTLDSSPLLVGRTYVIDIMINVNGASNHFRDCSPAFRIEE